MNVDSCRMWKRNRLWLAPINKPLPPNIHINISITPAPFHARPFCGPDATHSSSTLKSTPFLLHGYYRKASSERRRRESSLATVEQSQSSFCIITLVAGSAKLDNTGARLMGDTLHRNYPFYLVPVLERWRVCKKVNCALVFFRARNDMGQHWL